MPMAVTYTNFGGEIVSEVRGGTLKSYAPDSLGSTVAIYDSAGALTDTFEYWPYGEVRTRTGSTPTPFQYVGTLGYYTDATGNVYVRARVEQPKTTRWMSVDPLWPWESAYGYAGQAPTLLVDSTGLGACPLFRPDPCARGTTKGACIAFLCSLAAAQAMYAAAIKALGTEIPEKKKEVRDLLKKIKGLIGKEFGPQDCCKRANAGGGPDLPGLINWLCQAVDFRSSCFLVCAADSKDKCYSNCRFLLNSDGTSNALYSKCIERCDQTDFDAPMSGGIDNGPCRCKF